jgi:hypothetical protein
MHIVNSLMQCLALKHPESPDPLPVLRKLNSGLSFTRSPTAALESGLARLHYAAPKGSP